MSEHIIETEVFAGTPFVPISDTRKLREEIVRCKDCKHASYYKDELWCSELGGDDSMPVEPNDFCAWGSRK